MKYRIQLEERNNANARDFEAETLEEVREWADEQIKADRFAFGYNNRYITGYEIYRNDSRIIGATVEIDGVTEYNYLQKSNLFRKPF